MRIVLLAAAVLLLSACPRRVAPWPSLEIGNPEVVRVIRNSDTDPPTVGVAAHRGTLRAVATQASSPGALVSHLELRVAIESPRYPTCLARTRTNESWQPPAHPAPADTAKDSSPGAPELAIEFDLIAYVAGICAGVEPGSTFNGTLIVNVSARGTSGPISQLAPVRLLVGSR
jgi:hypothetical protein